MSIKSPILIVSYRSSALSPRTASVSSLVTEKERRGAARRAGALRELTAIADPVYAVVTNGPLCHYQVMR